MQTTKEVKRTITDEIDRIVKELEGMKPESPEYEAKVKQLKVLCEARSLKPDRLLNTDALIAGGINILGILLILNFEKLNVMSSKAIGFVMKGRM
ncbi:TPA: hypothetical protein DCQ22_03950 [Candidatus Nomurabacteria bacterium]|nr:hypothetical protein [Candidatus Nomurabacteria bacterium]